MSGNTLAGRWRPIREWPLFDLCNSSRRFNGLSSCRFPHDGEVWPGRKRIRQHRWCVPGAWFFQQLSLLPTAPGRSGVPAHQVDGPWPLKPSFALMSHLSSDEMVWKRKGKPLTALANVSIHANHWLLFQLPLQVFFRATWSHCSLHCQLWDV